MKANSALSIISTQIDAVFSIGQLTKQINCYRQENIKKHSDRWALKVFREYLRANFAEYILYFNIDENKHVQAGDR